MQEGVPDYLKSGLKLVIVGINPGLRSGATGHHYAYAGNHFWPLLFDSGLLPERLTFESDHRTLEFDIGLTNLCERTTQEANQLSRQELADGARSLRAKLLDIAPRFVCFNGMGIYEAFLAAWQEDNSETGKRRKISAGAQPERLGQAQLFVVPSSSGRTAAYPRQAKLDYFLQLKQLIDALPVEVSA